MSLSLGPIGGGPVGSVNGRNQLGTPPGTLVFVDSNGEFLFATPGGAELSPPTSAPAGSSGSNLIEAIDGGGFLVAEQNGPSRVTRVYDRQFNVVGSSLVNATAAASNHSDAFYVWEETTGVLKRISPANVVEQSWTMAIAGTTNRSVAVSPDDTTAYLGLNGDDHVSAYDLSGSGGLTTFVTDASSQIVAADPGILTLRNGNILVGWQDVVGASNFFLKMYNPAGTALATFPVGSSSSFLISLCVSLDNESFWWSRWTGSAVRVERIRISDGVVLQGFTRSSGFPIEWDNATMAVVPQAITSVLLDVSFAGGRDIRMDDDSSDYSGRHWEASPSHQYPYLIQGGEELGIAKAGAKVVGPVPNPSNVRIRGINLTVSGMNVPATAASLRTGTSDVYEISNVLAATAFPATVMFYKEFQIRWDLSLDNGATWQPVGTSSNPIYVCLADPLVNPATMFRTLVHLACFNSGATTSSAAATKTWELFSTGSAPKDVKTWDDVQLYYYQPGTTADANPQCSAGTVAGLLQARTGQCMTWARLLQDAWSVNDVASILVKATCKDKINFFVKDWDNVNTSVKFWYQSTGVADMVPGPTSGAGGLPPPYGYYDHPTNPTSTFWNKKTLRGQGSGTDASPSQKIFQNHQFLKYSGTYYDPSYGVTYSDEAAFQLKLAGWGNAAFLEEGYYSIVFGLFDSSFFIQFNENLVATVVSGSSVTSFTLGSGQGAQFASGQAVRVRLVGVNNGRYEYRNIASVSGDVITLQVALPAIPAGGDTMERLCM